MQGRRLSASGFARIDNRNRLIHSGAERRPQRSLVRFLARARAGGCGLHLTAGSPCPGPWRAAGAAGQHAPPSEEPLSQARDRPPSPQMPVPLPAPRAACSGQWRDRCVCTCAAPAPSGHGAAPVSLVHLSLVQIRCAPAALAPDLGFHGNCGQLSLTGAAPATPPRSRRPEPLAAGTRAGPRRPNGAEGSPGRLRRLWEGSGEPVL